MFKRKKIDHLKKLIANRLKYRILDYSNSISYYKLIIRLRQIDLNIKLINKQLFKNIQNVKIEEIKKIEEIEFFNTRVRRDKNNEKRENYFNNIIINRNERY